MDNNEIIDYVMHTPSNSNPNVMRDILEKSSGGDDKTPMVVLTYKRQPIYNPEEIPFKCEEDIYEVDINSVNYCIENKIPMFLGYNTISHGADNNGFSVIPLEVFGPHGSYESGDYEYIEDYTFNFDYAGYHYNLIYYTDTNSFYETIYSLKRQKFSFGAPISFISDIKPRFNENTLLDVSFFENSDFTFQGQPCDLIKISYTNQTTWELVYITCDKTQLLHLAAENVWDDEELRVFTTGMNLEPICTFSIRNGNAACNATFRQIMDILNSVYQFESNYKIKIDKVAYCPNPALSGDTLPCRLAYSEASNTIVATAPAMGFINNSGVLQYQICSFSIDSNNNVSYTTHILNTQEAQEDNPVT